MAVTDPSGNPRYPINNESGKHSHPAPVSVAQDQCAPRPWVGRRHRLYMTWATNAEGKLEATWHLDNDEPSIAAACEEPPASAACHVVPSAEPERQIA